MKSMKKFWLILVLFLILSLVRRLLIPLGIPAWGVERLENWFFIYNEDTNDYRLSFTLVDCFEREVSADVDVDVRIVNDNGEEVYRVTHSVKALEYDSYISRRLRTTSEASLRIPVSDIAVGTSDTGKVYLTVHKGNELRLDEMSQMALCLPIWDVQFTAQGLPCELNSKDFFGEVESTIKIEEVTFVYDKKYPSLLEIALIGTKTYGTAHSGFDIFDYRIYDSEGYMVDSGSVILRNLVAGDKFKDNTIVLYDVVPGESYTITFSEST